MKERISTRKTAKKLGVHLVTLQRHIASGALKAPQLEKVWGMQVRLWSELDIERARKVLMGIKPGRKAKKKS